MTTPNKFAKRARFEARMKSQMLEREQLKASLSDKHSLLRGVKFDYAFGLAWDHGHSNGLSEVESYFDELVPLLKP